MSSKSASCRTFLAFVLLAALVLAGLPAQARQIRHPAPAVTASGDSVLSSLWRFVVSLWTPGTEKEGVLIDPNGSPSHGSTPVGGTTDEGVTIDPNGSK